MPIVPLNRNLPPLAAEYQGSRDPAAYPVVLGELLRWMRDRFRPFRDRSAANTRPTRAELADAINSTPDLVRGYERGTNRVSLRTVADISRATSCEFWEVLQHAAWILAPKDFEETEGATRLLLALLWWQEGISPQRDGAQHADDLLRIAERGTRSDAVAVPLLAPSAHLERADALTHVLQQHLDAVRSRHGMPPLGWTPVNRGYLPKPRLYTMASICGDHRLGFWHLLDRAAESVVLGLPTNRRRRLHALAQLWEDTAPTWHSPRLQSHSGRLSLGREVAAESESVLLPVHMPDVTLSTDFPDVAADVGTSGPVGTDEYHRRMAATLRALRKANGQTVAGAAARAGITPSMLVNFETAYARPTLTALMGLAVGYARDLWSLLVHVARTVSPGLMDQESTDAVLFAALLRWDAAGAPGRAHKQQRTDGELADLARTAVREGDAFPRPRISFDSDAPALAYRRSLSVLLEAARVARGLTLNSRDTLTITRSDHERGTIPRLAGLASVAVQYSVNVWTLLTGAAEAIEPPPSGDKSVRYLHSVRWFDIDNDRTAETKPSGHRLVRPAYHAPASPGASADAVGLSLPIEVPVTTELEELPFEVGYLRMLGGTLAALRINAGYKPVDIRREFGMSQAYPNHYEVGRLRPRLGLLADLAETYNTDLLSVLLVVADHLAPTYIAAHDTVDARLLAALLLYAEARTPRERGRHPRVRPSLDQLSAIVGAASQFDLTSPAGPDRRHYVNSANPYRAALSQLLHAGRARSGRAPTAAVSTISGNVVPMVYETGRVKPELLTFVVLCTAYETGVRLTLEHAAHMVTRDFAHSGNPLRTFIAALRAYDHEHGAVKPPHGRTGYNE